SYCQFILRGGGIPILLTPGDFIQEIAAIVERLDGIVLTGGVDVDPALYGESKHPTTQGCNPSRDRFEIALLHEARRKGRAILGICRGIQLINVAFGGTLYQDIPSQLDGALHHHQWEDNKESYHPVLLTRYSPLTEIFKCEELRVNSSHHQAVKELGKGLVPLAASSDGVIEALHCPDDRFTIAVQWHPERMLNDPLQLELAKWFIRQAG
ncbi:MAG: gamma-glutamyl-gamma-aminobutyrate hydrolase family protein, partial [bacterium]